MHASPASLRYPWFAIESWIRHFFDERHLSEAAPAPRIGLVLSCGGARGLAHVGAIQVLEEAGIPIAAIIGSSMGAYVGALWASGLNGKDLEALAAEIKDRRAMLRLIDPVFPPNTGFVRGRKLRRRFARSFQEATIASLRRRMFVVATNLDTVRGEVLPPETAIATAVHASCAIPGICAPVEVAGKRYIDGGAAQPLPVMMLRKLGQLDHIIAVNVMPTTEDVECCTLKSFPVPPEPPKTSWSRVRARCLAWVNLFAYGNVLDTFKRCLTAAQLRLIADESAAADVVIHPFFCESKWYDFENFNRYIDAGRRATEAALPRIRALAFPAVQPITSHETVPVIPAVGCGKS